MSYMEIIDEPNEFGREVKRCIRKYGYTPEHNYNYFMTGAEGSQKSIFIKTDEGYGVLAEYSSEDEEVQMLSDALAPRDEQVETLHKVLDECFSKLKVKSFAIEQDDKLRNLTLKRFRGNGYRALSPRFSLYWPVFDMGKWTGGEMHGDEWKKLRNLRNRFNKEHRVEVVDSKTVDPEQLKQIVKDWVNRRKLMSVGANRENANMVYDDSYYNMIDSGFKGAKYAKTLVVDGTPSSITVGWEIPNSDNGYYSAIGFCNHMFEGLGEMANLDDLWRLKKDGYNWVDFGGSTMPQLKFKLKFRPHFTYATHTYTIVKK
jgi:hypothetical protein